MATSAKKGSALVIALLLLFVAAAASAFVLEKSVPASQGVRGIEDSNLAYYRARSGLEAVLAMVDKDDPFPVKSSSGASWSYAAVSSAPVTTIPAPGEGDSDYDQNWNKIGPADPVQVALSPALDISATRFVFRLPDADGNGAPETFSGAFYATNSGIVSWFLSNGSGGYLVPSDGAQVLSVSDIGGSEVGIGLRGATDPDSASGSLASKYAPILDCGTYKCTLRLSVIQPIVTAGGQTLPYLEYQILPKNFSSVATPLPERFLKITSAGYANGFRREIVEKVPQTTVTQGLDTTVFN